MKAIINKSEKGFVLQIPKIFAERLLLKHGSKVDVFLEKDELIVKPLQELSQLTLEYLMEGMTEESRGEEFFADLQGNEQWEY